MHLYIIGGIGLIDNIKGWLQATETTTILWILAILKHWGLTVKLHFLHTFFISDWNFKHFKLICILCFVMPLIYFPIEIRFTWAKMLFNPIKIKIKPTLWSCRLTLELELSSFYSYLLQWYSNPINEAWPLVHIIFVPSPFTLSYFWHQLVYYVLNLHYSSRKMSVSSKKYFCITL